MTKICRVCGKEVPATTEYFHRNKSHKDGLCTVCKACASIKDRLEYQANPDRKKEQSRVHRMTLDKKLASEYSKKYRAENAERIKQVKKIYSLKEKEKRLIAKEERAIIESKKPKTRICTICQKEFPATLEFFKKKKGNKYGLHAWCMSCCRDYKRQLYKKHPEKILILGQARRSRERNLQASYTGMDWENCKKHFDNKCAYCGKEKDLTQDHFIAVKKDGEYTVNNIVPACCSCNSSKQHKDFFEWYPKQEHYSKKREMAILKYLNYKDGYQQLGLSI